MKALDSIKDFFKQAAHAFGYYDERSRTTRVTGIEPFNALADEKAVTKKSAVSYFLKLYPDANGGKAQLSLLVEGADLSIPRHAVATRAEPRPEAYCHMVPLCKIPLEQGRKMIAAFDAGERMDFFLPYDAFDYSLVNAICDAEEKFGVIPPAGETLRSFDGKRYVRALGFE